MRKLSVRDSALQGAGASVDVLISASAVSLITEDSLNAFSLGIETMGLLYGIPFLHEGRVVTKIETAVKLPTTATPNSVVVKREGEIPSGSSPREGSLVVGWYHSHTGAGNFMSSTDEATQGKWFSSPGSVSLVYDASHRTLCAYRLMEGDVAKASFHTYRD